MNSAFAILLVSGLLGRIISLEVLEGTPFSITCSEIPTAWSYSSTASTASLIVKLMQIGSIGCVGSWASDNNGTCQDAYEIQDINILDFNWISLEDAGIYTCHSAKANHTFSVTVMSASSLGHNVTNPIPVYIGADIGVRFNEVIRFNCSTIFAGFAFPALELTYTPYNNVAHPSKINSTETFRTSSIATIVVDFHITEKNRFTITCNLSNLEGSLDEPNSQTNQNSFTVVYGPDFTENIDNVTLPLSNGSVTLHCDVEKSFPGISFSWIQVNGSMPVPLNASDSQQTYTVYNIGHYECEPRNVADNITKTKIFHVTATPSISTSISNSIPTPEPTVSSCSTPTIPAGFLIWLRDVFLGSSILHAALRRNGAL